MAIRAFVSSHLVSKYMVPASYLEGVAIPGLVVVVGLCKVWKWGELTASMGMLWICIGYSFFILFKAPYKILRILGCLAVSSLYAGVARIHDPIIDQSPEWLIEPSNGFSHQGTLMMMRNAITEEKTLITQKINW